GRAFKSLAEQNEHLWNWEANVADARIHGTTREHVGKAFREREQAALQALPSERFPFFHEGRRTVHRDGHVSVDKAFYSAPPEYLGKRVWVRWDARLVRIFNDRMERIALHARQEPGRFSTQKTHIAAEKISGVERGASWWLKKTEEIGPKTQDWATAMLQSRGAMGVRVLMGLNALGDKHPRAAVERACETATSYGEYRLRSIRKLIQRQEPTREEVDFLEDHPVIRPLSDYSDFVQSAIQEEQS
ncbi:MAG: Mu transposase C-terminal domain-containing protein, partial [Planctomycetales bacterium]